MSGETAATMPCIEVLLVDNHPTVLETLGAVTRRAFGDVRIRTASTLCEALQQARDATRAGHRRSERQAADAQPLPRAGCLFARGGAGALEALRQQLGQAITGLRARVKGGAKPQ